MKDGYTITTLKNLIRKQFYNNEKTKEAYKLLSKMKTTVLRPLPDKIYLKYKYRVATGRKLNIEHPIRFNEKMQWLKLYNRKPVFTTMVDKYAVKAYVTGIIGAEYVTPVYGKWDKFEDIDFSVLPNKFVLKCNHDCGTVIICRDKNKLDKKYAKNFLNSALNRNYYWRSREWPYKNVTPCIFAEELIEDKSNPNLSVYKFFCFDGEPTIIQTIQNDKQSNESIDYFDCEWNLLDLRQNYPNSNEPLTRPSTLTEMIKIAAKLSEGLPFVRVDLYNVEGKVMFSEFTFFSDAGTAIFYPDEWDIELGKKIKLPIKG